MIEADPAAGWIERGRTVGLDEPRPRKHWTEGKRAARVAGVERVRGLSSSALRAPLCTRDILCLSLYLLFELFEEVSFGFAVVTSHTSEKIVYSNNNIFKYFKYEH